MKSKFGTLFILALFAAPAGQIRADVSDGGFMETPTPEHAPKAATDGLGLSPEQSQKFLAAGKANHEAMQPLREKRKALLETLQSQVKAVAGDKDIADTLSQIEAVQTGIQAQETSFRAELRAIFSPRQLAKLLLGAGAVKGKGRN